MRLYASCFRALLVLFVAVSGYHTTEASTATCKTLRDSSSTLAASIESWTESDLSKFDFNSTFEEIDTALPWLSKCAAAIDPKAVYISLASSSTMKTCFSTLENFKEDLDTADGRSNACSILEITLIPCIKSAMTEVIMDALGSTGGCCDDLLAKVDTLFGDSLDGLVQTLAELGANVACGERTFTNLKGAVTKEMCMYSIVNSFTFIQSDDDMASLLNLVQIPNNQTCNAFAGKSFTNTKNAAATIGFGTNGVDTMGICLEPIDTLIQYMKTWKIFSLTLDAAGTSISLADLFTSGKSIRGNLLFSYATTSTNLPMIALRTMDNVIRAVSGGESDTFFEDLWVSTLKDYSSYGASLALHIPNNGGCSYSDQSITLPYADTASTAAGNGASTAKLSNIVTVGAALTSSLLLIAFF
ncbi:hypothetical protein KRP22_011665 [Phytophthora ramorum]|uniref:Elicitin-like protein n=1 Tax=Phytophthora ramorum TaxID=164328 RepID=H3GK65_PHYRM|nr:hypothetical protein KRP22_11499 [Phytophthora ramorum]